MGLIKKLFGGAAGIRESMRESYAKHYRMASRGIGTDETPHVAGLYGALGSRYKVSGRNIPEPQLFAELVPFLWMPEAQAIDMLAEYIVLQELPQQANTRLLSEAINIALHSLDEDRLMMATAALINGAPWCLLLDRDVVEHVRLAASKLLKSTD